MDRGGTLSDEVGFEIPTYVVASGLLTRLWPTWQVRVADRGRVWLVVVELRLEQGDLAVLLRDVQSWLEVAGLGAVRFELDGRDYVLEPVEAAWDVAAL